MSTVAPLGSYRFTVTADAANPGVSTLRLSTLEGALQLSGVGVLNSGGKSRFTGEAGAAPGREVRAVARGGALFAESCAGCHEEKGTLTFNFSTGAYTFFGNGTAVQGDSFGFTFVAFGFVSTTLDPATPTPPATPAAATTARPTRKIAAPATHPCGPARRKFATAKTTTATA